MENVGRMLVILGLAVAVVGGLIWALSTLVDFGRLPGDLVWRRGSLTVLLPIASSILLSLVLTLVLNLIFGIFGTHGSGH